MEFDDEGGCLSFVVGLFSFVIGCYSLMATFGSEPPFALSPEEPVPVDGFVKEALGRMLSEAPGWLQRTFSLILAVMTIGFALITPVRQLLLWILGLPFLALGLILNMGLNATACEEAGSHSTATTKGKSDEGDLQDEERA